MFVHVSQELTAGCFVGQANYGPFERAINVSVTGMGSLENALASLNKQTLITGGNRIVCEECTAKMGETVKCAFWEKGFIDGETISDILVFNLKRFTVQSQGASNVKLNDYLSFPMSLDLAPYCHHSSGGDDEPATLVSQMAAEEGALTYGLVGVIVHKGEASHGHYWSLIRHRSSGKWYKLDDETVTLFEQDKIPDECFGGINFKAKSFRVEKKAKNQNAFVLFYERLNPVSTMQTREESMSDSASSDHSGAGTQVEQSVRGLQQAIQALRNDRPMQSSHPGSLRCLPTLHACGVWC